MHTPHPRGAVRAIALVAVSVCLITGAAMSNGLTGTTTSRTTSSSLTSAMNGVDQPVTMSSTTSTTLTAAKAPVKTSTRKKKVVVKSMSRFKPKPVAPKPVPVPVSGTSKTASVEVTFFGAYDNDPSGSQAISNPVIHKLAGGVGSYADPLTFASPSGTGAYPVGTRIYVPMLQKYFIREDVCATSWTATDGCGAVSHVDLYMGNPSTSSAVTRCEDALTPNGNATIIINPASTLTYDPAPLWNQTTGACAKIHK